MLESFSSIDGIPLWLATRHQFLRTLDHHISDAPGPGSPMTVFTVNPEIAILASRDDSYHTVLAANTFNVVDGVGIYLALRSRGIHVPTRLCGSDMIYWIAERATRSERPLYFIGGTVERVTKACENLRSIYPGLRVEGISPSFSSSLPFAEQAEIEKRMTELRPAAVAVCLGPPKQEQWIVQNNALLRACDVRVAAGLGGTVDFVSGAVSRAPVLLQRLGFEWLFRLLREPLRIRRQMSSLPLFALRVLVKKHYVQNSRQGTEDC